MWQFGNEFECTLHICQCICANDLTEEKEDEHEKQTYAKRKKEILCVFDSESRFQFTSALTQKLKDFRPKCVLLSVIYETCAARSVPTFLYAYILATMHAYIDNTYIIDEAAAVMMFSLFYCALSLFSHLNTICVNANCHTRWRTAYTTCIYIIIQSNKYVHSYHKQ